MKNRIQTFSLITCLLLSANPALALDESESQNALETAAFDTTTETAMAETGADDAVAIKDTLDASTDEAVANVEAAAAETAEAAAETAKDAAVDAVSPAADAASEEVSSFEGSTSEDNFETASIANEELSDLRGTAGFTEIGDVIVASASSNSDIEGNSIDGNFTTGNNSLDSSAFSNAAGINVVIQNSGPQANIQSNTLVVLNLN